MTTRDRRQYPVVLRYIIELLSSAIPPVRIQLVLEFIIMTTGVAATATCYNHITRSL